MPGTGYDKDAEQIGLNITRGQRWLALAVFIVSVIAGMVLAKLATG